jgi:hypothetical protein
MFDDQAGWGTSEEIPTNDVIKDAMKKEQVIKCESFYHSPCSYSYKAGILLLIRTTSEVFAPHKLSLCGDSFDLTFSSALRACKDH